MLYIEKKGDRSMNTPEQVQTLKQALELSRRRESLQQKRSELSRQSFRQKPEPPVHEEIKVTYPPVKSTVKFWSIELLPTIIFLPWPIIYYFMFLFAIRYYRSCLLGSRWGNFVL